MKYNELKDEIKIAMKNHDNFRRDILRQVLNEVKNIEVNERREIIESDVDGMLKRVYKQTKETYDASVKANNNQERTEKLKNQLEVLNDCMPTILSGVKLENLIFEISEKFDKPNVGNIMKELSIATNGNFDKQFAAKFIKEKIC